MSGAGANNFPAHRTPREFRHLHVKELSGLFAQMVGPGHESGLVKLGRLGIDGTKTQASASKQKAMSYGRMRDEREELNAA